MHAQPFPAWYLYTLDADEPVHLLTDEGQPSPELSTEPARLLAELAAAIHATAWRLGEPAAGAGAVHRAAALAALSWPP
ncbi:hypothetical protein [Roseateles sp. YR242]|uniref:hypothetical protein n=1 Tax=Roseateles sp. YR242 TaxID=1855305 RepID=UPI000B82F0FF|nr:hypothetical protein [Roseateles sp. YR242]